MLDRLVVTRLAGGDKEQQEYIVVGPDPNHPTETALYGPFSAIRLRWYLIERGLTSSEINKLLARADASPAY